MLHGPAARRAVLSLALLGGLGQAAYAWPLFGKHHGCDTTVTLPPQRVVVETAAPRVVRESFVVSRGVTAPVMGAFYMPMAFPVFGLGVGVGGETREVEPEHYPLRSIHAAEAARLAYERARAIANVESRALSRGVTRDLEPEPAPARTRDAAADLDRQIKLLSEKIGILEERISAVEKLTLFHDNYLREKIKAGK